MCVIFRRITCRGHVGTLASIYGVGGWSRYIRSDRVEYLVLLCPSTPPRFHLCPSFSSTRPPPLSLRFASPRLLPLPFLPLSSCICFLFLHSSLSLSSYLDMMSRRERERERGRGVLDEIPFDRRFEDLLLLATVTRQRVVGSAATERTGVEKD